MAAVGGHDEGGGARRGGDHRGAAPREGDDHGHRAGGEQADLRIDTGDDRERDRLRDQRQSDNQAGRDLGAQHAGVAEPDGTGRDARSLPTALSGEDMPPFLFGRARRVHERARGGRAPVRAGPSAACSRVYGRSWKGAPRWKFDVLGRPALVEQAAQSQRQAAIRDRHLGDVAPADHQGGRVSAAHRPDGLGAGDLQRDRGDEQFPTAAGIGTVVPVEAGLHAFHDRPERSFEIRALPEGGEDRRAGADRGRPPAPYVPDQDASAERGRQHLVEVAADERLALRRDVEPVDMHVLGTQRQRAQQ